MRFWIGFAFGALGLAALAGPAWASEAADPAAYCRRVATDDRLLPVPAALQPQFARVFGIHAPPDYLAHAGYIRCSGGHVLGCTVGANLPCGPADTRRDIPGADAWCLANGDPAVIPAYVTGHATIYDWQCRGGRALPVRQIASPDARGFVAQYWRRLD